MSIVGDKDRMCPPDGCRKTFELFTNARDRVFIRLGPDHGQKDHYGKYPICGKCKIMHCVCFLNLN